jgi:nicotinate phosphoribosyltransferase
VVRGLPAYHPGLIADLYHPDAAYVAWRTGHTGLATFDLYVRKAPFGSAYLLTAGLEPALEFLQAFSFSNEDLEYLARIRDYDPAFLDELRRLRFSGEVLAMREGTVAFPNEPILRVTAPYVDALLVESGLLQAINSGTLIATKAARIVWAAQGRRVAEFALRRALEPFVVARASFVGGCASTSFLAAAFRYRLPATGSIPHALVQLYDSEEEAFRAVAESFSRYTLLLDTYDPHRGVHTAVQVARWAEETLGHTLAAVRLDSGDFLELSRYVRRVLDDGGMRETRILVSGDMDEYAIADLLAAGAPIDAFGVGTALGAASGSLEHGVLGGALGGIYKLVWYEENGEGRPAVKVAGVKSTWPGKKRVYRVGAYEEDVVALESEPPPANAHRLLIPVVRNGHVLPGSLPPIGEVWEHAQRNLTDLPERYRRLSGAPAYPVRMSDDLEALRQQAIAAENEQNGPGAVSFSDGVAPSEAPTARETRPA